MQDKLIDTNILVYAYDTSEGEKHEISRTRLREIWKEGGGVVCLQNLMEFFVVITKKVENPLLSHSKNSPFNKKAIQFHPHS